MQTMAIPAEQAAVKSIQTLEAPAVTVVETKSISQTLSEAKEKYWTQENLLKLTVGISALGVILVILKK